MPKPKQGTFKVWCDEWQTEKDATSIKAPTVRQAVREYADNIIDGPGDFTISARDSSGQLYAIDVELEMIIDVEVGLARKVSE